MPKRKVGHAANAKLNREWGKHMRPWWKRYTSGIRRMEDKAVIHEELNTLETAVSRAREDDIDDKKLTLFSRLDAEPFHGNRVKQSVLPQTNPPPMARRIQ